VTRAGLAAAAHRHGADATRRYLAGKLDGRRDGEMKDEVRDAIEHRLRTFQRTPF
jgi:hypothetical protein